MHPEIARDLVAQRRAELVRRAETARQREDGRRTRSARPASRWLPGRWLPGRGLAGGWPRPDVTATRAATAGGNLPLS